jgi:hypothetical protein
MASIKMETTSEEESYVCASSKEDGCGIGKEIKMEIKEEVSLNVINCETTKPL